MALHTETRKQFRKSLRRFVAERLRPLKAKVAEDDLIPAND